MIIDNKIDEMASVQSLTGFCNYLQTDIDRYLNTSTGDAFRRACVDKLCVFLGIRCVYNYKNEFFSFYSSIACQAISDLLNLHLDFAPPELKYIKHDGLNLVEQAKYYLQTEELEEAMIDIFDMANSNKHLNPNKKKNSF